MSFVQKLGWWYQCSGDSQFRDLKAQQEQLAVVDKGVKPSQTPLTLHQSEAHNVAARYLKNMFSADKAAVWSVPAGLLDDVGVHWSCNILDTYSNIVAAAVEVAAVPAVKFMQCDFFRVQDAYPESKRYIRPSHGQESPHHIVVATLEVEQAGDCLKLGASSKPNAARKVHLLPLCQIAQMLSILQWPIVEGSSVALELKAPARAMLMDALDFTCPLALTAPDDAAAIVPAGIAASPLEPEMQSLQRLCDANCWAHMQRFSAWEDLGLHRTALEVVLAYLLTCLLAYFVLLCFVLL